MIRIYKKLVISLLFFIFCVSSIQSVYAQENKREFPLDILIGYKFRITPIDIDNEFTYVGPWYLNTNIHDLTTGSRVFYGFELPLTKKVSFRFAQTFRYGMLYYARYNKDSLAIGQAVMNKVEKRLTTDLSAIVAYRLPLKKVSLSLSAGYSWNNLNSSYEYQITMNYGAISHHKKNLIFHGPFINVAVASKNLELGVGFQYIHDKLHQFVMRKHMIIPEFNIQYSFDM